MRQFKGLCIRKKFWKCARATHIPEFDFEMQLVKEEYEKAFEWLANEPPRYWSRSHFRVEPKCDILLNNLCETFNETIVEVRDKPMLEMLEWIRCNLIQRMVRRREWARSYSGNICPKIQKRLEKWKGDSFGCIADWHGELKFEVRCMNGDQYCVDLKEKTCSCRKMRLDRNLMPTFHCFYSK